MAALTTAVSATVKAFPEHSDNHDEIKAALDVINTYFFIAAGDPEGAQAAPVGSIYIRTGNGTIYVKNSGTGNTGWKLVTQAA